MFVLSTNECKSGNEYIVRIDFIVRNKKYFTEGSYLTPNCNGKSITSVEIANLKKYCINNHELFN